MSNLYLVTDEMIRRERKNHDKHVATLLTTDPRENTLLPETPIKVLQKALKLYRSVKPILGVITKLPIIPAGWRTVIDMLMQALDAVSSPEVIGEISAKFKAGRDLEEAA